MLFAVLLAAEAASNTTALPELPPAAQYGLLGIGIAALATGKFLIPRYVLDRERERADQAEERADRNEKENQRLNTVIQEKFVPSIVDASNAVRDATVLITKIKREQDIEREIEERRRNP